MQRREIGVALTTDALPPPTARFDSFTLATLPPQHRELPPRQLATEQPQASCYPICGGSEIPNGKPTLSGTELESQFHHAAHHAALREVRGAHLHDADALAPRRRGRRWRQLSLPDQRQGRRTREPLALQTAAPHVANPVRHRALTAQDPPGSVGGRAAATAVRDPADASADTQPEEDERAREAVPRQDQRDRRDAAGHAAAAARAADEPGGGRAAQRGAQEGIDIFEDKVSVL